MNLNISMNDKSLDRELRETSVRTGASPTGRTHHGRPGRLTLSRQNIFFPDVAAYLICID